MTLYEVSQVIREGKGRIWHINFEVYGTIFRADIGQQKARVVVARPDWKAPLNVPLERNSLLYIVKDLPSLKTWLKGIV